MNVGRFSIVTPSLNRARLLESAIRSVITQGYPDYEHIIVDGGSTDDTAQIVDKFPAIRFVSDPDQGMYDALNKGLEIASGEIVGFLNTDDFYADGCFSIVARKFEASDIMAVAGRAIVFRELSDGETELVNSYSARDSNLLECSTIGSNFFNAWFFRRSTFDQIGRFNTSYRIAGDRDFMLRFALSDLTYAAIDDLVYNYRQHADSLTFDKNSQKREWSADEHLAMTSVYLSDSNLSRPARKLLIQLRSLETVDMAARSMWMRNRKKLMHYVLAGLQYDMAWPLRFFRYAISRGMAIILAKRAANIHR